MRLGVLLDLSLPNLSRNQSRMMQGLEIYKVQILLQKWKKICKVVDEKFELKLLTRMKNS